MSVRIVTQAEVPGLLPMRECVELMREALRSLARGDAVQPLRTVTPVPNGNGVLASMPAYLGAPRALGVKVITVTPANQGTPFDSHQGAVLLFEAEHGSLVAVIDATSITTIRTAAVSAVATDALARKDAASAAILGSGVQAASHLEAMCAVRPVGRARVWSRSLDHAAAFAKREGARLGIRIDAARSAREAVEGAEIVCVATAAKEPVLSGEWIAPGAHVNAVGACVPAHRELDTAAVQRSRLFVDRRESALHEAGDILIPMREGAIGEDHVVGEIGELLLGRIEGRRGADEVTLFKSLGLAIEDLAAAQRIHANAVAKGDGLTVHLGGRRHDGA
jgi:ornithine cyclodeaminase/alanine dehydrogenase-like protein (mu-crystallin family)